jgi:hypothetical protein
VEQFPERLKQRLPCHPERHGNPPFWVEHPIRSSARTIADHSLIFANRTPKCSNQQHHPTQAKNQKTFQTPLSPMPHPIARTLTGMFVKKDPKKLVAMFHEIKTGIPAEKTLIDQLQHDLQRPRNRLARRVARHPPRNKKIPHVPHP